MCAGGVIARVALTLLEAQRHAMLMYTSCGWFFDDIAGLEAVQVLRYAARCMDLLREAGDEPPEDAFLDVLATARSNDPDEGTGREVWERHVVPARVLPARVVAHIALLELLDGLAPQPVTAGFDVVVADHEVADRGSLALASGTGGAGAPAHGRRPPLRVRRAAPRRAGGGGGVPAGAGRQGRRCRPRRAARRVRQGHAAHAAPAARHRSLRAGRVRHLRRAARRPRPPAAHGGADAGRPLRRRDGPAVRRPPRRVHRPRRRRLRPPRRAAGARRSSPSPAGWRPISARWLAGPTGRRWPRPRRSWPRRPTPASRWTCRRCGRRPPPPSTAP